MQEIRHVLGRNIVPRGALRLEITETLVMENPEQAIEVLETLRGAGAELALDDFGTGYSSLAYLQRFPFDTIKIDRELVRASNTASGAAIMRSIVALTHELSKKVVAEGVEHAEEAVFLRSIGCEYAQGYHFGEPIPERDVIHLLKMVRRSEKRLQPRGFFRPKIKTKKIERALRPCRQTVSQRAWRRCNSTGQPRPRPNQQRCRRVRSVGRVTRCRPRPPRCLRRPLKQRHSGLARPRQVMCRWRWRGASACARNAAVQRLSRSHRV